MDLLPNTSGQVPGRCTEARLRYYFLTVNLARCLISCQAVCSYVQASFAFNHCAPPGSNPVINIGGGGITSSFGIFHLRYEIIRLLKSPCYPLCRANRLQQKHGC